MIDITRLKSNKGVSRLIVIVAVIAIALVGLVILPLANKYANDRANETDAYYVTTAEREARVEFIQNRMTIEKVFNTENKKFVDPKEAKKTVKPYGTSKEHLGKYLLVKVDEDGNITTTWVTP